MSYAYNQDGRLCLVGAGTGELYPLHSALMPHLEARAEQQAVQQVRIAMARADARGRRKAEQAAEQDEFAENLVTLVEGAVGKQMEKRRRLMTASYPLFHNPTYDPRNYL